LSSNNPYRSLALHDELASGSTIDPHAPAPTRIARVLAGTEPEVPPALAEKLLAKGCFLLVTTDVDPTYRQHPPEVTLSADGRPEVVAVVRGDLTGVSPDIDGYVACPVVPLAEGVRYRLSGRGPGWVFAADAAYAR
jgi:hypothetical protein